MQNLSGTVGDGGANVVHDVALVQALLALAIRPASRTPYLSNIDGDCGARTKAAIRQFQNEVVFVGPGGNTCQMPVGATIGKISGGDATWRKLVSTAPTKASDLRVLNGSKIVYVAASDAQLNTSVSNVNGLTFQPAFRAKVLSLVKQIHRSYGIAIDVCPKGDRRTFDVQYGLLMGGGNVTHAGPGESNHNFGQAADLGFKGLCWLRSNGTIVENEGPWLAVLTGVASREASLFWATLHNEGATIGLHRGPDWDNPHLQAWSDSGIDMASRLADLLTRSGKMKWTGRRQRYQCDLGYTGSFFDVGTAAQIWSRNTPIKAEILTSARRQGNAQSVAPAATTQDVEEMRRALRADFDAADLNWQNWSP